MGGHQPQLDWIDAQAGRAASLIERWAGIHSGTGNIEGVNRMAGEVRDALGALGAETELISLDPAERVDAQGGVIQQPLGDAVRAVKRSKAPVRVFLGIHLDTVYGSDHPFRDVQRVEGNTLAGPGVLDAKGGLVVMLLALEALERSGVADSIGWEVLINPDEEIGSPGSAALLRGCAERNDVGLVFEPALPDGSLVDRRSGSGNFAAVVRGKAAHAGREFDRGRNAVVAAAHLTRGLSEISGTLPGLTVNVAKIDGGGAVNAVPDVAVCRFNVRMVEPGDVGPAVEAVERVVDQTRALDGIRVELHGGITSPPKPVDDAARRLMGWVESCGDAVGVPVRWRSTGGVCDGNKLAAAGLATIDTLGPVGSGMHSDRERVLLDSVTERARVTALLLLRLAAGEFSVPGRVEPGSETAIEQAKQA